MSQEPKNADDLKDKKSDKNDASNNESAAAGKNEPKSKSYAEILKGFEEIEKIFKRDKDKP